MNTFDPDNHEERWAHERTVADATGGKRGRCLDCGDPIMGLTHEPCWLRERRLEIAAQVHSG